MISPISENTRGKVKRSDRNLWTVGQSKERAGSQSMRKAEMVYENSDRGVKKKTKIREVTEIKATDENKFKLVVGRKMYIRDKDRRKKKRRRK